MTVEVQRQYGFQERLTWAEGISRDDLCTLLSQRLPNVTHVERANLAEDKSGVDFWAFRDPLPPLAVDLKAREKDFLKISKQDDLALETWSVMPVNGLAGKIGWSRDSDKRTDYILWWWTDTRRFFLFPFHPLCRIFSRYWMDWAEQYGTKIQRSDSWQSQCVFVPRKVLLDRYAAWCGGQFFLQNN